MGKTPRHAPAAIVLRTDIPLRRSAARAALGLLLLLSTTTAIAALTITLPRQDSLTEKSTISVRGTASGETVAVRTDRLEEEKVAEVNSDKWSVNLPLAEGLNVVTASSGDQQQVVLVTRAAIFVEAKRQKVFLQWPAATTEELKTIALRTLLPSPNTTQQDTFATAVKQKTRTLMAANFSRFGIDIFDTVAQRDANTHTIDFVSTEQPLTYGLSPQDCLNNTPGQVSKVYVGTFRHEMVNDFGSWAPMKKTDSLDRRIQDVAHALARTASHELGHSLGLVTDDSSSSVCNWMKGCDTNHNCPYSSPHPLLHRFNDGRYIMDSGKLAKKFIRIAEKKQDARSMNRAPATFNTLYEDYLLLILGQR